MVLYGLDKSMHSTCVKPFSPVFSIFIRSIYSTRCLCHLHAPIIKKVNSRKHGGRGQGVHGPIRTAPAGGAVSSAPTKFQSSSESPPRWLHFGSVTPADRPPLLTERRPTTFAFLFPGKTEVWLECLAKMLACTEMITMCLQSAKQKHLRAQQQQPQRTIGQGLTIFHDVSGSNSFTSLKGRGKTISFICFCLSVDVTNLANQLW